MKKLIIIISAIFAVLIIGTFWIISLDNEKGDIKAKLSVIETMADMDTAGYARADKIIDFTFPEDHGPHNNFKTEWWYLTGNLTDESGRQFGYQLTIFRSAISPDSLMDTASFAANQLYLAHFALSDIDDNEFYSFERLNRSAAGIAGAKANPMKIWNGDWKIEQTGPINYNLPDLHVYAEDGGNIIDFTLSAIKPPVFHGENGLSQKSNDPGNASYYYSYTRLKTTGRISTGGKTYSIFGWSWMDREWSTSALTKEQSGWDWFSLQLNDTTEVMFFTLRKKTGGIDFAKGSYINQAGELTRLEQDDVQLKVLNSWESSRGGSYPSGWQLNIPSHDLKLKITPKIEDQELDLSFRYWEGAVSIEGSRGNNQIKGSGYAELTGYAE